MGPLFNNKKAVEILVESTARGVGKSAGFEDLAVQKFLAETNSSLKCGRGGDSV